MEEAEAVSAFIIADTKLSDLSEDGEYLDKELQVACFLDSNCVFINGRITPAIYKIFAGLFDEIIEGRITLSLDSYEKLVQRTSTNFNYELYRAVDDITRSAKKAIHKALQAEPSVTKDLSKATSQCAGRLEGLEFRVKTLDSLRRKIQKEPQAKIRDVLRYTEVSPPKALYVDYQKTMQQMTEKGYQVTDIKNYWNKPYMAYNGVNTNLVTPHGYEFELQFHTKESFDLKNDKLHELYEKQRLIDKEKEYDKWQELENEMFQLSDELERPKQIESIGD